MKLRNKKTGEIATLDSEHTASLADFGGKLLIEAGGKEFSYDTLAELNEDWEDYKPVEPLIKDEKIRKAVRAWAEALDLRWFRRCSPLNAYTSRLTGHNAEGVCYTMELAPKDLYGDKITKDSYTLAELCGEEEE